MPTAGAAIAADRDQQRRRAPPQRLVRQPPGHAVARPSLASPTATPPGGPVWLDRPAGPHRTAEPHPFPPRQPAKIRKAAATTPVTALPPLASRERGVATAAMSAVDVPVLADAVGREGTEAVAGAGGDGVHQIDSAVAVEHDRFPGMRIDSRDKHRLLRPVLAGKPSHDYVAPARLARAVGNLPFHRPGPPPPAHVGRILSRTD